MYSRNYLSTDNYPILPPGYSGVALKRYAQSPPDASDPDSLPRRPLYEDIEIDDKEESAGAISDENDSGFEEESGDERINGGKEKERAESKSSSPALPAKQTVAKSSHDDILIAGIIMLLISEGKCDELTLFLLGFLLL